MTMPFDSAHLLPILPEVAILVTAGVVLVTDLYKQEDDEGRSHGLTLFGLLIAFVLTGLVGGGERTVIFDGNVVQDAMSGLLKQAILIVSALAFIYARPWLRDRQLLLVEFYVLGLCAVLGMLVMVAANSLLTLYLGLELLSLSMYALVAFDRDSKTGPEAAMKYFVLGSLGSGLLLYGASMIYGATGSIEMGAVLQAVAKPESMTTVLVFGIAFLVIGIGFKFAAVPFHMWLPDTYEGAPTPVALILSSAPKIAAFALAVRLLIDGLEPLYPHWEGMLVILAVLSIILGNVVAIAQTNIKRMLGYSTISHVGFIFLGLIAGSDQGYASAMFYTIVYAITSAGAFGILTLLSREGFDAEKIEDLKGLNDRDPLFAAMMALMMFSLAGVPPTVGFMGKLLVLEAVVRVDMLWLAILAVALSIVGAFYYLRVVKYIYFEQATVNEPIFTPGGTRLTMTLNGLAVLYLGIFPASLLGLCQAAFS
jgi:NADH-quinone oxidoreductase subunit N